MSSIVVDTKVTDQHLREDGSPWPMALVRGDQTIFAETATELVGHLIEGYADLPDTEDGTPRLWSPVGAPASRYRWCC